MDKIVRYLGMILLLTIVSSCIRESESECYSQYTVRVFVKDKNYTNVDAISPQDRIDESLPFRKFVGTVYFTLSKASTGELVQESALTTVVDDADYFPINLNGIPYGDYKLTVWGNTTADVAAGNLHQGNKELTDVYLGSTDLKVKAAQMSSDVTLQRTKGLLLVQFTNFPSYIKGISANVVGVYGTVSPEFAYAGNTSVAKEIPFQLKTQLLLAPSVSEGASKLRIKLYATDQIAGADPVITLPETSFTVRRNEMGLVTVNYNAPSGNFEIWTYINGEWTMIHSLDPQ